MAHSRTAPAATIRVLIADDHAVVREGIRHVLSSDAGFDVVGEAASGTEAVALARALHPDVVVLDLSLPELSGLEAASQIRASVPDARILVLSIHDHGEYVLESMRVGANGYLCKDSSPAELRDAVRALHRGENYFSAVVAQRLAAAVEGQTQRAERARKIALLTPRERDVVCAIVKGLTNKAIAAQLQISPRTVESHRESLMQKLGVRHVAALTRLALEEGISES